MQVRKIILFGRKVKVTFSKSNIVLNSCQIVNKMKREVCELHLSLAKFATAYGVTSVHLRVFPEKYVLFQVVFPLSLNLIFL